jgi:hypothetical protein
MVLLYCCTRRSWILFFSGSTVPPISPRGCASPRAQGGFGRAIRFGPSSGLLDSWCRLRYRTSAVVPVPRRHNVKAARGYRRVDVYSGWRDGSEICSYFEGSQCGFDGEWWSSNAPVAVETKWRSANSSIAVEVEWRSADAPVAVEKERWSANSSFSMEDERRSANSSIALEVIPSDWAGA